MTIGLHIVKIPCFKTDMNALFDIRRKESRKSQIKQFGKEDILDRQLQELNVAVLFFSFVEDVFYFTFQCQSNILVACSTRHLCLILSFWERNTLTRLDNAIKFNSFAESVQTLRKSDRPS